MNRVILTGRLVKEPEVNYTQSGKCIAKFTLAVDSRQTNAQGGKTADFINIVAWNKLAETCGNWLTKGQKVLVEGRLSIRSYETNDGQKRWTTEVIIHDMEFLEKKSAGQNNTAVQKADGLGFGEVREMLGGINDEEIPF